MRELPSRYPIDPGDPVARVVETGRSEILTGAGAGVFGPAAARARRLQADFAQAALLVPLKARGRIIGIVVFASLDPGRRYGTEDLLLAEDLARRAALALDNARLYEDLGGVARALQAALLPQRLPDLVGVELAARFRPAGDGSLIGGDFYDVLPFDGGVDLVIGDVTGKGARAAALTSLVRHTVRTAARYEPSPSRVLDVVNRTLVAERSERGRYCTVAFCRVELNGIRARDDLLRRAPAADGHARVRRDRARRPAGLGARLGRGPEAARRRLRARPARVARPVHRRRDRGPHDRRRLRPRRVGGTAARGGRRGRGGHRRAGGSRRGARRGAPR